MIVDAKLICFGCCYKNKQLVHYASTRFDNCDECGEQTKVYIFTEGVLNAQERDRDTNDYFAEAQDKMRNP